MRKVVNIGFVLLIGWSIFLWSQNPSLALLLLIGSSLVYLGFNLYGSLYLSSNYFIKTYTKPDVTLEKSAVLTFDDGPHVQTDAILQVLDKHDCKASFFVIGKQIASNEGVLRKIAKKGHIIGGHSFYHKSNFPIQTSQRIQQELYETNKLIHAIIGKTPRFFRPPFGVMSPFIAHAVKKSGLYVMGWNVRSFDTENNLKKTLERVKVKTSNKPNVIYLLHDSTENIAELLDSIIIYLKENNYKIIPLSEAFKLAAYEEH